jgi:hypothetical protein
MPSGVTRRHLLATGGAFIAGVARARIALAESAVLAFARSLYAFDNYWSGVTEDEETTRKYLDQNLADLILQNYAKEDFESALDYDPLLQAQDWDEVKTTFTVNSETEKQAVVTVAVENFGERTFITLELTNTTDGWRLSDIRGADGASLVEELKRLNAAS